MDLSVICLNLDDKQARKKHHVNLKLRQKNSGFSRSSVCNGHNVLRLLVVFEAFRYLSFDVCLGFPFSHKGELAAAQKVPFYLGVYTGSYCRGLVLPAVPSNVTAVIVDR